MTSQHIQELKKSNYVLKAQPSNNYWVNFFKAKLYSKYVNKFGDNFNIIIYSKPDIDSDYYIIPFRLLKNHFTDSFLSKDNVEGITERWVLSIKNHILSVTNCPETIDVKEYFSNPFYTNHYETDDNKNDYEIENKKSEIYVRVKQSKFRQKVLENFNHKCCLSNIQEQELLVASHIVPWKDETTSRLDPANGLCLFVTYDKLFDQGYFTLTDDFKVLTVSNLDILSPSLRKILSELNGQQINSPNRQININYIKYHRTKIFIDREK